MRAAAAAIATAASLALASIGAVAAWTHLSNSATGSQPPPAASASPTPTPALPSPSPNPNPNPSPKASPSPSPTPPPSLYVFILEGDQYGNVRAETQPGATCSLRATLPNGSDAPGLRNPQTAGADGVVVWVYSQLPTEEGTGVHTVSCSLNGLAGTAWLYFEVGS